MLYHGGISTCSQKARMALHEKGVAFDTYEVDVPGRENLSDWYLAINPNGVVPTLVHDGVPIVDSSVICEYVDEVWPAPALSPPDAPGRARMRAWMRYLEEVPTAAIRVPSYNLALIRHFQSQSREEFLEAARRRPVRRHFYEQMGQAGFSETAFRESLERLQSCLERVQAALADGRPWLLGEQFTIADIVLLPSLVRMQDLGLDGMWAKTPKVGEWVARMAARPSFAQTYYPGTRLALPR
jgi:glutathione S-transferase